MNNFFGLNCNGRGHKKLTSDIFDVIKNGGFSIVALTEVALGQGTNRFVRQMELEGYAGFLGTAGERGSNTVYVGIRKDAFETDATVIIRDLGFSNFVHIVVGTLNIIVFRIPISNIRGLSQIAVNSEFSDRKMMMEQVISYASNVEGPVISIFDANNGLYHQGETLTDYKGCGRSIYSLPLIRDMFESEHMNLLTPSSGYSWKLGCMKSCLDHIAVRDLAVENLEYVWYDVSDHASIQGEIDLPNTLLPMNMFPELPKENRKVLEV
ncbi:endonuclease/exonuclease/phosphatase family protein [Companilactobacillus ginsenosidimutans]|uniref:Uncharacterized protein n=1 Tax=Companilactobacillus ginsenosidimutans TaxID=1007676 RepID=A0A0H4QHP2_9LACO|nr:endonuclease/exonuclease/phosphatase family protein [Companilactobacillus ginsenosidimutans]AKP67467.1 hypothetical protein ABM34_07945 [Companilactobacillus ginsenosidimutans]